jgi:outer membrane protein OmpA-like peptidoglycan-associated protein
MRKASVLLVGILVLLLISSCGKKPAPVEETAPPVVTEPETPSPPPVTPDEDVTKKVITQDDLNPIYFDFDRYDLRTGDREILNRNAAVLKQYPLVKIRI